MKVNVKVYGLVQGVFFRHTTKQVAEKLGLVGWIKNTQDGSVETLAQGPKDKLDEFVVWCQKGPPAARVERVKVDWGKDQQEFEKFEIM